MMDRAIIKEISVGRLGIWNLKESESLSPETLSFSLQEHREFNALKSSQRRKEYLAVRHLLMKMTGVKDEILYDGRGKPRLKNSPLQISISHSSGLAVILLSECKAGIDVEHVQRDIQSVAKRFLSDKEQHDIQQAENTQLSGTAYWCAKEAAFKCADIPGLEFKSHIAVFPFELRLEGGAFSGELRKENPAAPVTFYYFFHENNFIVYCVEEKEHSGQKT